MKYKNLQKLKKNKTCPAKLQRSEGFVMLFAVTLSALLLAMALGASNIALKEVRFSTNARDTNDAFFAADTGIECALNNDNLDKDKFIKGDSIAKTINCANPTDIQTKIDEQDLWTFVIPGLGSAGKSCAKVTVDKRLQSPNEKYIVFTSKGYNIGEANCTSSNPNRVEREIVVKYLY